MGISPFNQLARTTCRIAVSFPGSALTSIGTGFFLSFPVKEPGDGLMLVTNRHVVANGTQATLSVSTGDSHATASAGRQVSLTLDDLQSRVVYHPDPQVDLAAISLVEAIADLAARGLPPSHISLRIDQIAAPDQPFSDVEEILMIGYPKGLFDQTNNRPVIRRGITATSLMWDYEGKTEFLIDAVSLSGSSGSPVVIANEGAYSTSDGIAIGSRFHLVGILYAQASYTEEGKVDMHPVPTGVQAVARTQIPMNLGVCVKAHRLHELVAKALAMSTDLPASRGNISNAPSPSTAGTGAVRPSGFGGGYLF